MARKFNQSDPTANKAIANVDKARKHLRHRVGFNNPAIPAPSGPRMLTIEYPSVFVGLMPHEARLVGIKAFQAAGSMEAVTLEHLQVARAEVRRAE